MIFLKFPNIGGFEMIKRFVEEAVLNSYSSNISTSMHEKYYMYIPTSVPCEGNILKISIKNSNQQVWAFRKISSRKEIPNMGPSPVFLDGYINFLDKSRQKKFLWGLLGTSDIMTDITRYFQILVDREGV
jgi:hypothetical protein